MPTGFYARLKQDLGHDDELAACVEQVVNQLQKISTSSNKPGMLLGKIQSGKTRAFIGVIARAFDAGFDIAIVLTKGTKTLSAQTVARHRGDFKSMIETDEILVFDIKQPPGKLAKSERKRKLVIVAKKQADNLNRLIQFFKEDYPDLKQKNVLLVDDEADLASVRFVKNKKDGVMEQGTIADQIDQIRGMMAKLAYLQVTATPYSLYLQPDNYEEESYVFKPKRPAFTKVLPIHGGYVGGDDYFGVFDKSDPRYYLFQFVSNGQLDALRSPDRRRVKEGTVLDSTNTKGLVQAILTFLVGVCIRQWQQKAAGDKVQKYAMVIHNDTQTRAHQWQFEIIDWISQDLTDLASKFPKKLSKMLEASYEDLAKSVKADKGRMPAFKDVAYSVLESLKEEELVIEKVNKDTDVMALLDEKAELKLRTPYNVFVGGSILDRGITIPNMICFFYGRNPKSVQADTTLQHLRIYGNRDRRDLAVTRFFTSKEVYGRMYAIHEAETILREAFEKGAHDNGVVFIQSEKGKTVKPCAPNKLQLSNVVGLKPNGFYMPTNFDTKGGAKMSELQKKLNTLIPDGASKKAPYLEIDRNKAMEILDLIQLSLIVPEDDFEWPAMKGLIDYYANVQDPKEGKVLLLSATGRQLNRLLSGDKSGLSIVGPELRKQILAVTRDKPMLILLQQEGTKALEWSGNQKFWWPILVAPSSAKPCVFATKVVDNKKR